MSHAANDVLIDNVIDNGFEFEVLCDDGETTTIFATSPDEAVQEAVERGYKAISATIW